MTNNERYCKHPRKLVRGGEAYYVRCGALDYGVCPSCAKRNAGNVQTIIRAGIKDKGAYDYYLLTLTAPSFGAVDSTTGLPKNTENYYYAKQVKWNNASSKLFNRTLDMLKRELGADKLEYVRVAEYQRRGAVHYHTILRTPASVDVNTLGTAVAKAHKATHAGIGWGRTFDLMPVVDTPGIDGAPSVVERLARLAGYATKELGRSQMLTPEQRSHYSRLDASAQRLGLSDKAIRGLGYAGQTFTQSKGWSDVTKKVIAEVARANAEGISERSLRARVERHKANAQKWAQVLAGFGHTGTYAPNSAGSSLLASYRANGGAVRAYRDAGYHDRRSNVPVIDGYTPFEVSDLMAEIYPYKGSNVAWAPVL